MDKILVVGYGNADRQDDGVAWHVLVGMAKKYGLSIPSNPGDPFETGDLEIDFLFMLQLLPELVESIKQYRLIFFVDAHTGEIDKTINFTRIFPANQTSSFSHHMTPEMLLAISKIIYGTYPEAYLLSIRGYEFSFQRELSPKTKTLARQAIKFLSNEINKNLK